MTEIDEQVQAKQKLAKMVKDIDFCMLTTIDEDGSLRSRPMSLNKKFDFDGDLWFFCYGKSHKVVETKKHPDVNVSFSDIQGNNYVSISGIATLVRDKEKIKELWIPELKVWFPEGLETPDLALLKVAASKAEYWDGPNALVATAQSLVAFISGKTPSMGENQKIALK